jgi:hypothetical protein
MTKLEVWFAPEVAIWQLLRRSLKQTSTATKGPHSVVRTLVFTGASYLMRPPSLTKFDYRTSGLLGFKCSTKKPTISVVERTRLTVFRQP